MARFKVLHTDARDPATLKDEQAVLAKIDAEIVLAKGSSEDDLIEAGWNADAVLNTAVKVTRRVIESLQSCKVIVRYGIGFDTIDVDAATDRGIVVANVPDYCIEEVSNHALTLLLTCSRKICRVNSLVKDGQWAEARAIRPPMGKIYGQTLGIVAFGNIGSVLAAKAKPLGLRVLVHDPYISPEVAARQGVELVSLDRLAAESDYISIHTPLNAETHHMFNADFFRKMKPTAYIVNTSRGPVVDEAGLTQALREGWIAGAGLDVWEKEPVDPDNPLLRLDNVVATNHMAFYSDDSAAELRRRVAEEVSRVLTGHWPCTLVNKAVREKLTLAE